eukprot:TRINITY_DN226_c0_g1_i10.p1 TRINITY_DN226_c0_g1~~TRINITY_DN226_c0_g1_i10.p1  ORF type:complete len:117 (-),score=16.35 TRINITY_DN226_c0_g1_i10:137-487(-)
MDDSPGVGNGSPRPKGYGILLKGYESTEGSPKSENTSLDSSGIKRQRSNRKTTYNPTIASTIEVLPSPKKSEVRKLPNTPDQGTIEGNTSPKGDYLSFFIDLLKGDKTGQALSLQY